MKYDMVKILGSIACTFVFYGDCYGMDTKSTENKCKRQLYYGIFKKPPEQIAKKIQEEKKLERKQREARWLAESNPQENFSPTIQQTKSPE